jgi:hypothetical protein
MKVFVSWSGERGRYVAAALCELLRRVLPASNPWMSTGLSRGSNWSVELLDALREAQACLICATADSLESTWLPFEAGMLHAAAHEPLLARCVCFDVLPRALEGSPLAMIPARRFTRAGLLELLCELNASLPEPAPEAGLEAAFERIRAALNEHMGKAPEAASRRLRVVVPTDGGLCPMPVIIGADTQWEELLERLRHAAAERAGVEVESLASYRCLDLDTRAWVDAPLVCRLRTTSIALMPATDTRAPPLIAAELEHALVTYPAQASASASMRRDLSALVQLQQEHLASHGRYASSARELDFWPSPGTTLEIGAGDGGFHAVAERNDTPATLAIRVGDGAGRFDDEPELQVFVPRFQPTTLHMLELPKKAD